MIYFIGNKEKGFVKIGVAKSVKNRFYSIQADNPYDLEILLELHGNYKVEKYLHNKFKENRIRGEWYKLSKSILDFISNPEMIFISDELGGKMDYSIENIKRLYIEGVSNINISKELKISIHIVRRIIKNNGYAKKYREYKNSKPSRYYKKYNDNKKIKNKT
jgi:hypothetical protein